MSMDVSSLGIEVKSSGIKDAAAQLDALGASATSANKRVGSLTKTVDKFLSSLGNSTAATVAYNTSIAGIVAAMGGMSTSVQDALSKVNELSKG